MSPREALQVRIAEWLMARPRTFTAPFGVLTSLQTIGKAKVRSITFGIARTLDAQLIIWSEKRLELRTSRGDERFTSEAEFYRYAVEHYGASERV